MEHINTIRNKNKDSSVISFIKVRAFSVIKKYIPNRSKIFRDDIKGFASLEIILFITTITVTSALIIREVRKIETLENRNNQKFIHNWKLINES